MTTATIDATKVVPLFVTCFMCEEMRAHRNTRVRYCICGWGEPGDVCQKCGEPKTGERRLPGYACRECHEILCFEGIEDAGAP